MPSQFDRSKVEREPLACWTLVGISIQLHQYVPGFDNLVSLVEADFASSGADRIAGGYELR
jgi:hypothetical protein